MFIQSSIFLNKRLIIKAHHQQKRQHCYGTPEFIQSTVESLKTVLGVGSMNTCGL